MCQHLYIVFLYYVIYHFVLQKTRDKSTCTNLAAVIHACIAPKSGKHIHT